MLHGDCMPIAKAILSKIENNDVELTHLNLSGQGITDHDVELLAAALKNNTYLKHIDLTTYRKPDQGSDPVDNFIAALGAGSTEFPNHITAKGASLLAQASIESLEISGNSIGDEGAIELSRSQFIKVLKADNCEITIDGAMSFLNNKILEDLWLRCNPFDQDENDWIEKINSVLDCNRANRDPEYKVQLEYVFLEKEVVDAIDNDDVERLCDLIPKLKNGINTILNGDSTLLMCAVNKNSFFATEFLLKHGARIEIHEREYTPSFLAAENCKPKIVELLLKYGSNINGEFYFNDENALSIAAFKFCNFFVQLLKKINFSSFESTYTDDSRFSKLSAIVKFNELKADLDGLLIEWDMFWQSGMRLWSTFGERKDLYDNYTQNLLTIFILIKRWVYGTYPEYNEDIDIVSNYAQIYYAVYKKIKILAEKPPTTELDEQASDTEDDVDFVNYHPIIISGSSSPIEFKRDELEKIIQQLNHELENKTEEDIDWSKYPKFFIAQYRGIHYYRHHFTKQQRTDHRRTVHLNRIAPAPAVYYMSGLTPTQHQFARETVVEQHKSTIQETFEDLEKTGDIKQYWQGKPKKQFANASDMLQQRMSNAYGAYREDIIKQQHPVTKLLFEKSIIGYPHYATSDLPFHALKYAYGQKKITGLTEWRLRPQFQESGNPLHPYPGKIFISMFTPLEMYSYKTRHVAGKHNRKDLFLKGTVVPERETSIPGGLNAEAPFYEELLRIPSFDEYDESYKYEYGIDVSLFEVLKKMIADSWINDDAAERERLRKMAKNKIIENTIMPYKEKKLLALAQNEARRRGGILIYRYENGIYGLEPEGLRIPSRGKEPFYSVREEELLNTVMADRFINTNNNDKQERKYKKVNPKKRKNIDLPDKSGDFLQSEADCSQENNNSKYSADNLYEELLQIFIDIEDEETELNWILRESAQKTLSDEAQRRGFFVQDVARDGSCFFHAVADQLHYLHINNLAEVSDLQELTVEQLRQRAVLHIIKNQTDYQEFFDKTEGKDFNAFVAKLKEGGVWADHVIIQALSRALNINLEIMRSDATPPTKIEQPNARDWLHLGYIVGWHYQSLHFSSKVELQNQPSNSVVQSSKNSSSSQFFPPPAKRHKISDETGLAENDSRDGQERFQDDQMLDQGLLFATKHP